jgi:hypothetical protein
MTPPQVVATLAEPFRLKPDLPEGVFLMSRPTRRSVRRALIPLVMTLATVGVLGWTSTTAHAASTSAELLIKGPGSTYTTADQDTHTVALAASPGSSMTFAAKVVNTGSSTAQYLMGAANLPAISVTYTVAGTVANGLIDGESGYFTPPIAPGKSIAVAIKVTLPKTLTGTYFVTLAIGASDDTTPIDEGIFAANVKPPSTVDGPGQVFVKNGSSAYVGGPYNFQFSSSPALAVNGSTTFTAHMVNGAAGPDVDRVQIYAFCPNYGVTVKAGTADVTAAVLAGTYETPTLAVNGHFDLSIKVTYLGQQGGNTCDSELLYFDTHPQSSPYTYPRQLMVVDPAA